MSSEAEARSIPLPSESRSVLALERRCLMCSFHLRNGATLHRLNWLADLSKQGVSNSFGIMANYVVSCFFIDFCHAQACCFSTTQRVLTKTMRTT